MMMPNAFEIFDLIDHSWPPAEQARIGAWTIRTGLGGSKRTMAATPHGDIGISDLRQAEAEMAARDQPAMVQIRGDHPEIDALLEQDGYSIVDPCTIFSVEAAAIAGPLPMVSAWIVPEALACQREIWQAGGICDGRLAIMENAAQPKTTILGRTGQSPAGTAFVAAHKNLAMIHAIEVLDPFRRRRVGTHMMTAAANWCVDQGISHLTLICLTQNTAATALYASMGMQVVGHYHYRIKE